MGSLITPIRRGKISRPSNRTQRFPFTLAASSTALASAALASASAALASASAALALASSLSSLSIFSKGDSFWRVKSRPAETCPEGKEDNARGGKEGNIRIEGGNLRETVGNKRPREEDSNRAGFNKPLRIITKPRRQAAYPSAESATTAQIE